MLRDEGRTILFVSSRTIPVTTVATSGQSYSEPDITMSDLNKVFAVYKSRQLGLLRYGSYPAFYDSPLRSE